MGGLGGRDTLTTGATQVLNQSMGTPGLSNGGGKGNKNIAKRQAGKAAKLAKQAARLTQQAERANERAEAAVERAEEAAVQASRFGMRINAPEFIPSSVLANREMNRGMRQQENYLMKLMRNENNENNNNFNNLMRKIHKKRLENN
jgi:hypothetical protein